MTTITETFATEAFTLNDAALEEICGGGRSGNGAFNLAAIRQNVPVQTVSGPGYSGTRNMNGGLLSFSYSSGF